jgi:hypothetical protein
MLKTAKRHARGGQLDRQRNTVEVAANITNRSGRFVVEAERRAPGC